MPPSGAASLDSAVPKTAPSTGYRLDALIRRVPATEVARAAPVTTLKA